MAKHQLFYDFLSVTSFFYSYLGFMSTMKPSKVSRRRAYKLYKCLGQETLVRSSAWQEIIIWFSCLCGPFENDHQGSHEKELLEKSVCFFFSLIGEGSGTAEKGKCDPFWISWKEPYFSELAFQGCLISNTVKLIPNLGEKFNSNSNTRI